MRRILVPTLVVIGVLFQAVTPAFAQNLTLSTTPTEFPVGSTTTAQFSITNATGGAVGAPIAVFFEFTGPASLLHTSGNAVITVVSRTGLSPSQYVAEFTSIDLGTGAKTGLLIAEPDCLANPFACAIPVLASGDSIAVEITLIAGPTPGATGFRPSYFTLVRQPFPQSIQTNGAPIVVAVVDFDSIPGAMPPGSLVMFPADVQPPLGYTFVGSFQQSLRPSAAGSNGGGAEVKVQINMYRKN